MNAALTDFETLGWYEPGVFHLRVENCEDLSELNRLPQLSASKRWVSTFLHEYIHFLQDVTSTHGLLYFNFYIEELKNANKQVLEGGADFQVPLGLSGKLQALDVTTISTDSDSGVAPTTERVRVGQRCAGAAVSQIAPCPPTLLWFPVP